MKNLFINHKKTDMKIMKRYEAPEMKMRQISLASIMQQSPLDIHDEIGGGQLTKERDDAEAEGWNENGLW